MQIILMTLTSKPVKQTVTESCSLTDAPKVAGDESVSPWMLGQ
jgi:hypothetical protein